MTESMKTSQSGRKRRVRKKRPRERKDNAPPPRHGITDLVSVAMLSCGLIYALVAIFQVWTAIGPIQGVALGMTGQDVRDQLGPLSQSPQGLGTWHYVVQGNRLRVNFGKDQRVSELVCEETAAALRPCANILGVMVHSTEAAVKLRLGSPDHEGFDHGDKLVTYEGLGTTFRLHQSRVIAIDVRWPTSLGGRLRTVLWLMVP